MTRHDPDSFGPRWTPKRKESIALALHQRQMTVAEAKALTGASRDELASWLRRFRRHGRPGLRQLKTQELR